MSEGEREPAKDALQQRRAHLPGHDARVVGVVGIEEVDAGAGSAEFVEVLVELKDLLG